MRTVALSIAGSDPSGGAGIQADLKTFHQHGVFGCAVPTLLTVQNTRALEQVEVLDAGLVAAQLDAVLSDMHVSAAKSGALGSAQIVRVLAERVERARTPLVVDTVQIAKHGRKLLSDDARTALLDALLPRARVVTVNAPEAAWLCEREVATAEQALEAARWLRARGVQAVLVKGGHLPGPDATDLLVDEAGCRAWSSPRLETRHTHGVGCALSAAICARLALGETLRDACAGAKLWLHAAIASAPGLGTGFGPVDHFAPTPPIRAAEAQGGEPDDGGPVRTA